MQTIAELSAFIAKEHLWLRMGHDGMGWWASLRNDRRLTFEGRGPSPAAALEAARSSFQRWKSSPPTLS